MQLHKAKVTYFGNKGFGFVEVLTPPLIGRSVFCHIADVKDYRYLHPGEIVLLDVIPSAKQPGKLQGVNVELIEAPLMKVVRDGR